MLLGDTKEGEKGMCPVIGSKLLHSQPTDVFMVNGADRPPLTQVLIMRLLETEEGVKAMCPEIGLELPHLELTDLFLSTYTNRCALTQSPDQYTRGHKRQRGGDVSRHSIRTVPRTSKRRQKVLICLAAGLPLP